MITRSRRESINKLARKVAGPTTAPYGLKHLEALITSLGGGLNSLVYGEDGSVTQYDDTFTISVEMERPATWVRFNIAHQLGHLVLHMKGPGTHTDRVLYKRGFSAEEAEANTFARALLMPANMYRRKLREFDYEVEEVGRFFGVEVHQARTRGRWLGIVPWSSASSHAQ